MALVKLVHVFSSVVDTIDRQPVVSDAVLAVAQPAVRSRAIRHLLNRKAVFLKSADGVSGRHALIDAPKIQRVGIQPQNFRRSEFCDARLLMLMEHDRRTPEDMLAEKTILVFVGRCNVENRLGGD